MGIERLRCPLARSSDRFLLKNILVLYATLLLYIITYNNIKHGPFGKTKVTMTLKKKRKCENIYYK